MKALAVLQTPNATDAVLDTGRVEEAVARLRAAGLRVTEQRRALIRTLIRLAAPASIETIHGALRSGTCDLVTAYRSLSAFEGAGVVRRVFAANGTALIHLNSSPERFYVVDKQTHAAEALSEIPAELFLAIQQVEDQLRKASYSDVQHLVQFFASKPNQ